MKDERVVGHMMPLQEPRRTLPRPTFPPPKNSLVTLPLASEAAMGMLVLATRKVHLVQLKLGQA